MVSFTSDTAIEKKSSLYSTRCSGDLGTDEEQEANIATEKRKRNG